ncbi:MAG TPA: ABC transporter permease [Gemmataceae bacterium]|nr:ABC transporter permease [Gemmataceae bacterium]
MDNAASLPSSPGSAGPRSRWNPLQRTEVGLLLAIVVVIVLTGLLDPQHTYFTNPRYSAINILRQTALLGIFALGSAIVIIAGGIDLSSGSMIAFSGTTCATIMVLLAPEAMEHTRPLGTGVIVVAILGTLLVGVLIGSLHAWLITVVGLPPFVATLASLVGLRSLARAITEFITAQCYSTRSPSSQIQISDERFCYLAQSVWIPVLTFVVVAVLCWLVMSRTVAGRHLHALGGNEQAARLSGIHTNRLKWLAYCISAVLASVAGIFYIGDQTVADPQTLGISYELNAIAAAVVGGCSLAGGVGTMPGTVLGTLFLITVIDAVSKIIKAGADTYQGLIVGIVVVFAVAFTQWRQATRQGMRFFAGPLGVVAIINLTLLVGVLGALVGQKTGANPGAVGGIAGLATLVLLVLARIAEGRSAPDRIPPADPPTDKGGAR